MTAITESHARSAYRQVLSLATHPGLLDVRVYRDSDNVWCVGVTALTPEAARTLPSAVNGVKVVVEYVEGQ